MGVLLNTPSGGQSEVLETLHYEGAIGAGIPIYRLGPMVSHRWGGDEDREGSDPTFEADIITVLGELQTAGYVTGHNGVSGNVVDLTAAPPPTTYVVLTGGGRADARHPRPRPTRIIR
jgi:hypothetical protein